MRDVGMNLWRWEMVGIIFSQYVAVDEEFWTSSCLHSCSSGKNLIDIQLRIVRKSQHNVNILRALKAPKALKTLRALWNFLLLVRLNRTFDTLKGYKGLSRTSMGLEGTKRALRRCKWL